MWKALRLCLSVGCLAAPAGWVFVNAGATVAASTRVPWSQPWAENQLQTGQDSPPKCFSGPGIASCYTMTLRTTGSIALRGASAESEQYTCRTFLSKTAGGGTEAPLPLISVNDYKDQLSTNLEGWEGPGTYNLQSSHHPKSFVAVNLTVGTQGYDGAVTGGRTSPMASAVVHADGSVTLRFSNLAAVGHPSRTVSGTADYSCKNI